MSLTKPSLNERELLKKAQEQGRAAAMAELEKKQRAAQQQVNQQEFGGPNQQGTQQGAQIFIPSSAGIDGLFRQPHQPIAYHPPKVLESSLTIEQLQQELFKRKEELNQKVNNMTLDADHYRVNIPSIKLMTEDKTKEELIKFAGNIAVTTGVPLIVVVSYLGEIYGFSEQIEAQIKRLMEFYTVSEVLNVRRPT